MKLPQIVFMLLFIFLIAGCSTSDRPQFTNEIQVTIREGGFTERRWHIPAGEDIQVQMINQTEESVNWSILTPTGTDTSGTAWFSVEVTPGSTLNTHFRAPAAAGKYDVVSASIADPETRWFAEIVVVQP